MTNYYKYNFIPPFKLYAEIEWEMRSYIATGIVDNTMFPRWTEHCIREFRSTFLPIKHGVVCIENGQGKLPEDFKGIRQAYSTYSKTSAPFTVNGSFYYPKDYKIVTTTDSPVNEIQEGCYVETFHIVRKVTEEEMYVYHVTDILPESCYSIEGDCLQVDFQTGVVHLNYYSDGKDEDGYQLIPDDHTMQEYIKKYIIYMMYKIILAQTTDESWRIKDNLLQNAKGEMYDAKIKADIESKKDTTQKRMNRIAKSYRRNDHFRRTLYGRR